MFILHLICKCDIYKCVFALMKLSASGVKRALDSVFWCSFHSPLSNITRSSKVISNESVSSSINSKNTWYTSSQVTRRLFLKTKSLVHSRAFR